MNLPDIIEEHLTDTDFNELITSKILNIYKSSIREWENAEKPKEFVIAANNYNPQSVISAINQLIYKTEIWYISQHNRFISGTAQSENISPSKWIIKSENFNWLNNNVIEQKRAIEYSVNYFDSVIVKYAEFARDNSGFRGFANGFLKGISDPIDAIKGIWGNSNDDKYERELQTAYQKSIQQMAESFDELDEQLKNSIFTAYLNITSVAIEEIHYEGEQERIRKLEEERQRKAAEDERRRRMEEELIRLKNEGNQKKQSNMIPVVVVLLGIIIVLLLLLLKR